MTKQKSISTSLLHLFILGLIVLLFKLPSIEIPFDEDSGVHAYHARLILGGEPLYTTHYPTHHLPGSYYTFAVLFLLFGDRYQTIKIFLIFWVWVNSAVIYQIGTLYKNRAVGFLAAVLFILIGTQTQLSGDTAATEILANLPLTLVIFLAYFVYLNPANTKLFYLIGILCAVSIFYKAVYLSSLFAVGVMLVVKDLIRKKNQRWRQFFASLGTIAIGGFLFSIIVIAYFLAVGALNEMFSTITMGVNYLKSSLSFLVIPILPLFMLGQANITFAIISLVGMFWIILKVPTLFKTNPPQAIFKTMLFVWAAASIFVAGVSRFPYPHYSLLLVPPFSLLVSIFLVEFLENYRNKKKPIAFSVNVLGFAIIFAIFFNTIGISQNYYRYYLGYKLSNIDYEEFLKHGPYDGEKYYVTYKLANYIQEHTGINDYIFCWTKQPQIYYLSDRGSSSDVLWIDYIPIIGPPQRVFDKNPKLVIVEPEFVGGDESPQWLSDVLVENYTQEVVIEEYIVYRSMRP